jgi:glycosyltransferase involved in cell wall biosynthesis
MISVVIPTLNGERYLGAAIDSVLGQDHRPVEIIVVDDGSSDDTARIARSFPEVTYLRQDHAGIGAARNLGVARSSGGLLAFLDHDDLWEPGKLELQVRTLERDPSLEAVLGHVIEFVSPEVEPDEVARLRPALERAPGVNPGAMLIRRESFDRVGPFETRWTVAEWIDWYARAQERGLRVEMLPDVVLRRRLHGRNQGIREARSRVQYVQAVKAALDRRRAEAER